MMLRSLLLALLGLWVLAFARDSAEAPAVAMAQFAGEPRETVEPTPTAIPPKRKVVLRGTVMMAKETGDVPLPGATVIVWASPGQCEWSVKTDRAGRFERRCGDVIDPGIIQVHVLWTAADDPWVHDYRVGELVDASGRGEVIVKVQPMVPGPGPTPTPTAGEDELRYISLTGKVVDSRHLSEPVVAGAKVVLGENAPSSLFACLSPIYSDRTGFFEAWCPQGNAIGSVDIQISAEGFRPWGGQVPGRFFQGRLAVGMVPEPAVGDDQARRRALLPWIGRNLRFARRPR